jgi:hypothetical protein
LPAELISLVHHVRLNEAGWWESTFRRVTLAAVWLSGPGTPETIQRVLTDQFGITIEESQVREVLRDLSGRGALTDRPDGFDLTAEARTEVEADLEEGVRIEDEAKDTFLSLFEAQCSHSSAEAAWELFNDLLLAPLVRDLGAETYRFMTGGPVSKEPSPHLDRFLSSFDEACHAHIRVAVLNFLNPVNATSRAYVLRRLSTYFLVAAAHLPRETLERINELSQQKPSFTVFVDTNFLFSFLSLHDNPANEAATTLTHLTAQLGGLVDMRFVVLPDTLAEAKIALGRAEEFLSRLVLTRNLARGTRGVVLSGLAQQFVNQARRPNGIRKAADYFGPIIDNLRAIAGDRQIQLFNEDTRVYRTRQDVIDDIVSHLDFQQRTRGERAKSYEQVAHDIVLWHLVRDRRPTGTESPLAAQYWVATVDYGFIGFNVFKTHDGEVPVCIHPSTLVQMLQFWVPRTEVFEQALISQLRLPFLFLGFDLETERATIRILETLTHFEHFDELSPKTVTQMVINATLRDQIGAASSVNEEVELVRLALVSNDRSLREQLQESSKKAEELQRDHEQQKQAFDELQSQVEDMQRQLAQAQAVPDPDPTIDGLKKDITDLKKELGEQRERSMRSSARVRALISLAIFLVLMAVALIWIIVDGEGENVLQRISNSWVLLSAVVIISLLLAWRIIGRDRLKYLGPLTRKLVEGG